MNNKPQVSHTADGQLQLPPNAIPLVVLFLVPAEGNEKESRIGIIVNEKADVNLLQTAIEQAQKVMEDRKLRPQALQTEGKSDTPKLTDILGS